MTEEKKTIYQLTPVNINRLEIENIKRVKLSKPDNEAEENSDCIHVKSISSDVLLCQVISSNPYSLFLAYYKYEELNFLKKKTCDEIYSWTFRTFMLPKEKMVKRSTIDINGVFVTGYGRHGTPFLVYNIKNGER